MKLRRLHVLGPLLLWWGAASTGGCGGKIADLGPSGGSGSGSGSSSGAASSSSSGTASSSSSGASSSSGSSSGNTAPTGCEPLKLPGCTGAAYHCTQGSLPTTPGLYCANISLAPDGTENYCCETRQPGCELDDSVECSYPATGFSCVTGDDPSSEDSELVCSAPVGNSNGRVLFCCEDAATDGGGG